MNNTWLESQAVLSLIATAGLIIVAIINQRGAKKRDESIKRVEAQVSNSHKTNLRDDVDSVGTSIGEFKKDTEKKLLELEALMKGMSDLLSVTMERQTEHSDQILAEAEDIRGVRKDVGRVAETTVSREQVELAKHELLEEMNKTMRRSLEAHVQGCPVRNTDRERQGEDQNG